MKLEKSRIKKNTYLNSASLSKFFAARKKNLQTTAERLNVYHFFIDIWETICSKFSQSSFNLWRGRDFALFLFVPC